MATRTSNRNHPVLSEYYPVLADLIGIYWHFHKDLLAAGSLNFAMGTEENNNFKLVPFDIEQAVAMHEAKRKRHPFNVFGAFTDAVALSMVRSWKLFLREGGATLEYIFPDEELPIPEETRRYANPYVLGLINDAVELEKRHPDHVSAIGGERALSGLVKDGIYTGALIASHLKILQGEHYHPHAPVQASKIRVENIIVLAEELGLKRDSGFDQWESTSGNYTLLDDSKLGLDRDRLRELGLGDALGCPASIRMSAEATAFLQTSGIEVSGKTVTQELAEMIPAQFDHYVGEWYRGLSPERQRSLIDPELARIMSGEARRTALEERSTRCPNGKERM